MVYNKLCVLAQLILVSGYQAGAQAAPPSMNLEEIRVTAAGVEQPLSSIPGTVQVLDRQQIIEQSIISTDISDILANLAPGYSPSNQLASNFGQTFRGKKAVVLVDGILMTTPIRNGSREFRTVAPEVIERIEVIKGSSALYGNGYAGGVINIVTRQPGEESDYWFNGRYEFQPEDLSETSGYAVSGGAADRLDSGFDYLVNLSYYNTGSFVDADGVALPDDQNGQGGYANGYQYDLLAKLGQDLGDSRLELTAHRYYLVNSPTYNRFEDPVTGFTEIDTGSPYTDEDPENNVTTLQGAWKNGTLFGQEVNVSLSWASNEYAYATTVIDSEKIKLLPVVRSGLFDDRAGLTWGVDLEWDNTTQAYRKETDSYADNIETHGSACWICDVDKRQVSPFVQLDYELTRDLTVQAGLRYETYRFDVPDYIAIRGAMTGTTIEGGTLDYDEPVFNLGAVFNLTDNLETYGGFSQGFAVDDLRRLRGITRESVEDFSPFIPPTKSHNLELGLRGYLGDLHFNSAVFYTWTEDASHYGQYADGGFPLEFLIYADEETYGFELTADYSINPSLNLGGTFSWNEGRYEDPVTGTGESLNGSRITPEKLTGYIEWLPGERWQTRLQAIYVGGRDKGNMAPGGGYHYYESPIDSYTVLDLSVSYLLPEYGKLSLSARNLLNADYVPASSQINAERYTSPTQYKAQGRAVSLNYSADF